MVYGLEDKLVIGISSGALFDLKKENAIFEKEGMESCRNYQIAHENEILKPGPGFALVKALLELNKLPEGRNRVEVIVMSRNSPDTSIRVFNAIRFYNLAITRAVLVNNVSLTPYLKALKTDLFLSTHEEDVQAAVDSGIAAGIICENPNYNYKEAAESDPVKIAFDADAVIFSDESECIFKRSGLAAFEENERKNAKLPLMEGPFASLLKVISRLQKDFPPGEAPIRTALVTSRCAPAHERVIRTLREWDVRIDEAFFLGGIEKKEILKAFGAHIFFDDQSRHTIPASEVVLSARVPTPRGALYHEEEIEKWAAEQSLRGIKREELWIKERQTKKLQNKKEAV